ncbi:MAG: sodium transporter [Bacteroidetes bacterium]|nr:MAG: sodium transporter [Bacteroidota bacterium]
MNHQQLNFLDHAVLIGYFALILVVSLYLIFKEKKTSTANASSDYFLGGKNLSWFVIGASLFASNIGSEHLVGLAGAGAAGDFPAAQFEILAAFMLLLLGWLFVPLYLRSGVFTMPQFLERRYGPWARNYLTWVSILGYVITKIALTITAGGIIFTTLMGIDFWTGAIIVVVATGVYTIFGGLKVVVYTDMIQMFILLGGSIALSFYGLEALGGWSEIERLSAPSYSSLWRPLSDPDFPWTGILFGAPILGVWYWCTDQFIVQRVLAARNIDQARKGTIFAAYLKMLPLFIFVVPGLIAYALSVKEGANFSFPQENGEVLYDAALPMLTMQLLPAGLRGLVVAGLIAALMSSLSSVFNSCSTLFTIDVYQRLKPETSEKQLVKVGRIATGILVILGLAWIPLLDLLEGGLFQKLQSIQSYISPPIASVFLLGVFSKRITAKGAKYALLSGAVLGATRLILELNKTNLPASLSWYVDINFLHFALLLFLICTLVLVLVSISESAPNFEKIKSLLYSKSNSEPKQGINILLSVVLVLLIGVLWIVFS